MHLHQAIFVNHLTVSKINLPNSCSCNISGCNVAAVNVDVAKVTFVMQCFTNSINIVSSVLFANWRICACILRLASICVLSLCCLKAANFLIQTSCTCTTTCDYIWSLHFNCIFLSQTHALCFFARFENGCCSFEYAKLHVLCVSFAEAFDVCLSSTKHHTKYEQIIVISYIGEDIFFLCF